jgi:demethylmenaquinone methyltransferase/2-methoxy-6-polyprenyl-1,4-benzoquinol methylase
MSKILTKNQSQIANLFNAIAPKYDWINSVLSFGLDRLWRKKCIQFIPKNESLKILDLACGSCKQMIAILKARPLCDFTGVDISEKLIKIGEKNLEKHSLKIDKLLIASALELPFEAGVFDVITISFGIRNMENIDKALEEVFRVLKKGGKIFILEFSLPTGFLKKKIALFYLKYLLPKIGYLLSTHSYAYTYLNDTIVSFPYGKAFINHLEKAKFSNNKLYPMSFGMVTLYVGEKNETRG